MRGLGVWEQDHRPIALGQPGLDEIGQHLPAARSGGTEDEIDEWLVSHGDKVREKK